MNDSQIDKDKNRNAKIFIALSLRFAKEYFNELCELRKKHTETEIQSSKDLNIIHRALWTCLIVEIRKLFGSSFNNYEDYSLIEIPFFKEEPHKNIVNGVYSSQIVQKILKTSNTFTIHLGKKDTNILMIEEICKSNLGKQLEKLQVPVSTFEAFREKK